MKKEVERIREDIEALVTHASQQDAAEEAALGSRRGDELPAELARREARLATIEAAMRRLEAEAKAEADAERQRRLEADAERQRSGKKRRGKAPQEIDETPADKAQMSFTDRVAHHADEQQGWDYLDTQISVDGVSDHLGNDVTDAANDKQQAVPVAMRPWQLAQAGVARPGQTGAARPFRRPWTWFRVRPQWRRLRH
jgi:hypothetical protein